MHSVACLLAASLALAGQAFAAIDCNSNITINKTADVKAVRDQCRVFNGNFILPSNFGKDVNLDGVEVIRGDVLYQGCGQGACPLGFDPDPVSWNFTSSTLREISGNINLRVPGLLTNIHLPNLRVINGSIELNSANDLVELNLKSLQYAGSMSIDAPRLEKFVIDELKGFATGLDKNSNPDFWGTNLGHIASIDGIFKGPLDPIIHESADYNMAEHTISIRAPPNLDKITLGWTRFPTLRLSTEGKLEATLGGPSTESMYIDSLYADGDVTLNRSSVLKNLTVREVTFGRAVSKSEVDLPFDNVSQIYLDGSEAKSLVWPPQAANWDGVDVFLQTGEEVDLSPVRDREGKQTWYWPKRLGRFVIIARISNEFFESFMEQNIIVTSDFEVYDFSGRVDCNALKDYVGRTEGMTKKFSCRGKKDSDDSGTSGASSILMSWTLGVSAMAIASWILL